jgi:serine/threonine protein kinase
MYELIGEGSYGCVVKPVILNKIKKEYMKYMEKDKNDIGKLFISGYDDFKTEYDIGKFIHKLDKNNEFTTKMKGAYKIWNKLEGKVSECMFHNREFYEIIYENGGKEIDNVIIKDILTKLKNLLKGLQRLHKNGFLHMDIKPANLLINLEKISLIDYGLTELMKNVYKNENRRVLSFLYPFYPPEFMIMYNVLKERENNAEKDYKSKIKEKNIFQSIYALKKYYKIDIKNKERLNEIKELLKKDYINIIKKNTEKADIYSIGIVLLIIKENIEFKNKEEEKIYNEIVKNTINHNVEKRWSSDEIIKYIEINMNNKIDGGKSKSNKTEKKPKKRVKLESIKSNKTESKLKTRVKLESIKSNKTEKKPKTRVKLESIKLDKTENKLKTRVKLESIKLDKNERKEKNKNVRKLLQKIVIL